MRVPKAFFFDSPRTPTLSGRTVSAFHCLNLVGVTYFVVKSDLLNCSN